MGKIESKLKAACLASSNAAERYFVLFVKVKAACLASSNAAERYFYFFVKIKAACLPSWITVFYMKTYVPPESIQNKS